MADEAAKRSVGTTSAEPPRDDWAAETADRLDQLIATVKAQTTDRVVKVARLLVYGLLAAIMGLMAAALAVVMLVRFLDEMVPQEVWLTYLLLGASLTAAGLFCWSKRKPKPAQRMTGGRERGE